MNCGDDQESLSVVEGSPTIAFAVHDREKMLPYFSLMEADYCPESVILRFTSWQITIEGERLEKLWKHLASQDLARVAESTTAEDRCLVTAIRIERRNDEENEPE